MIKITHTLFQISGLSAKPAAKSPARVNRCSFGCRLRTRTTANFGVGPPRQSGSVVLNRHIRTAIKTIPLSHYPTSESQRDHKPQLSCWSRFLVLGRHPTPLRTPHSCPKLHRAKRRKPDILILVRKGETKTDQSSQAKAESLTPCSEAKIRLS